MTTDKRLLIIDDDVGVRDFLQDVADELSYETIATSNADEFFAAQQAFVPTLIMIDLMMPDVDGVEILRRLGEKTTSADVVLMSGADEKVLKTAQRLAESYGLTVKSILQKPVDLTKIEALLSGQEQAPFEITVESLAAAIENNELEVFYQPKIGLSAPGVFEIDGAEALVRWRHPTKGLIFPDSFIALAESSQLIGSLTEKVLELSLKQIATWMSDGLDLKVAVNLAPQMLTDLTLPDRIAAMAAEEGVPGTNLVLEITERAAMDEKTSVMDILTRFRLKGFGLSMDDFGIGYSSLKELYRMPFSELKIDRSFISEIEKNDDAKTIVRAIVVLAKSLSLSICAEGAESAAEVRFLQSIGCDKCQGYHFSKPLPVTEFNDYLKNFEGHISSVSGVEPFDPAKSAVNAG